MRKIVKGSPVKSFSDFVKNNKPNSWSQLPVDVRHETCETIFVNEQNCLSGYTERLLEIDDPNTHIDHFRKRSLFSDLTFDWDNLIVAEHSSAYGADMKDNGKTTKVKTAADYSSLVDPVHENPHDFFDYMANGEMVPHYGLTKKDTYKALFTIDCFCLNNKALVEERAGLIKTLVNMKQYGYSATEIRGELTSYNYPSVVEFFCSSEIFDSL